MDLLYRNILLTHENVIKLADLGAAKVIKESLAKTYTGTVAYMSPEQRDGEIYSFPTDIWYKFHIEYKVFFV